jgi:hypothetical protein
VTNIRRLSPSDAIAPCESPDFVLFTRERRGLNVPVVCSCDPRLPSDAVEKLPGAQP